MECLKNVKQIGFQWKKLDNNRKLLIETDKIQEQRVSFLKTTKRYGKENLQLFI